MKFDGIKTSKPRPIKCYKCGKELDENIYNWDFDDIGATCVPFCHRKFKDGVGA